MNFIWESPEGVTIPDVLAHINSNRKDKLKRSTVQVQMNRLEDKGWISHRKIGNTYLFKSVEKRSKALAKVTQDMKSRVFGGSIKELVKCLFDHSSNTESEITEVENLLKEYKKGRS
ncbi:MAG: BlaI/MecI/CopY family transcriptional regulator [Planctomycetes bacterium]|nr:BlaI/MecI/CopY family transcriptional regulator [Planctomycetota bacterium]